MEPVSGVQLYRRWPNMTGDQQIRCIHSICQMMKEMVDLDFPAYGSLYFPLGSPCIWTNLSASDHIVERFFGIATSAKADTTITLNLTEDPV